MTKVQGKGEENYSQDSKEERRLWASKAGKSTCFPWQSLQQYQKDWIDAYMAPLRRMVSTLSMNRHMRMREEKQEPQGNGRGLSERIRRLPAAIIIGI